MEPFVWNNRFNDIDQLGEALRSWDVNYSQLDPGSFKGMLRLFGREGFEITYGRFNRSLVHQGSPPAGLRTLAIPTERCTSFRWRRQEVAPRSMVVFPRDKEWEVVSSPSFEVYTLSFEEDYLNRICRDMDLPDYESLSDGVEVIRCHSADFRSAVKFLEHSFGILENRSQRKVSPALIDRLKRGIAVRALSLLGRPRSREGSPPVRLRDCALERAVESITEYADVPISVGDLCEITEASERTLEYAFRERYGTTAKGFILKHRLNGVRRQLCSSDAENTTIADVANEWGFWHMGQFARDYRKLFGELPSETRLRYS